MMRRRRMAVMMMVRMMMLVMMVRIMMAGMMVAVMVGMIVIGSVQVFLESSDLITSVSLPLLPESSHPLSCPLL